MANKLIVEIEDFTSRCYNCTSEMIVANQVLERKHGEIIVKCNNCGMDSTFLSEFGKINIIEVLESNGN